MKHLSLFFTSIMTITFSSLTWAGSKEAAPGPEFGEGSIGLLALGVSAVAYAAYRFKNRK